MTDYDPNNIFAKIMKGEMPCHKVYEDDKTFAFLDIMPRVDGHTLVLPKNPARNIFDVAPDDINAVMATTQKIARAVMSAFKADGVTIQQFNEEAGDQMVFHLHVHVLPRHAGVALKPHTGEMADQEKLAEHARVLVAALAATE